MSWRVAVGVVRWLLKKGLVLLWLPAQHSSGPAVCSGNTSGIHLEFFLQL